MTLILLFAVIFKLPYSIHLGQHITMLWKWVKSGTQVFILDLDGTLMPSAVVDNECFWQAVYHCFGPRPALPDLHGFKNVTDSGILDEWCTLEMGRSPTADEISEIQSRFVTLLKNAADHQPGHFEPLPGVRDWMEEVNKSENVVAGIATGGWRDSARLKLEISGLNQFKLPMASSDDAMERSRIMEIAAQKTLHSQHQSGASFTYVGDGIWDLQASQALGWNFIGIAHGARAMLLQSAGADNIRQDFCRHRD
jgi:phosphoglycolate phosphatase-like HAD superfamily hydrolase